MENVILEILPPPCHWSQEKIDKWSVDVCHLLRQQGLLSVSIPEVVDETRNGERNQTYIPKIDNMHFAGLLKHHLHSIVVVPNKICVRLDKQQFAAWIDHIYEKGIRHLVLVGAEKNTTNYPGYSVIEATRFVKKRHPEIKLGGITIFTRKGEAKRLFEKMQAGMDFFCSQIIFEAANMKHIVLDFAKLCRAENQNMPRIYLSLALASKSRDIEFMKWLGVEFPTAVHSYLTEDQDDNLESRSLQSMDLLLDEVFHFMEKDNIDLGFNIEHIMYSNLHLSEKLFKDIKQRIAKK